MEEAIDNGSSFDVRVANKDMQALSMTWTVFGKSCPALALSCDRLKVVVARGML